MIALGIGFVIGALLAAFFIWRDRRTDIDAVDGMVHAVLSAVLRDLERDECESGPRTSPGPSASPAPTRAPDGPGL